MNYKGAFMDTVKRYIARVFRIEEGEIKVVHWHMKRNDPDLNVCDVILRDRKVYLLDARPEGYPDDGNQAKNRYYIKERVPVLQSFIGSRFGFPWTPRVGDLVKVLFYQNEKAIILGPSINWEQKSVCRFSPYDVRWKWCQWQKPPQNPKTLDYGYRKSEGFVEHPEGKKPFCFNIWHGIANDRPTKGRDFGIIWDYCQEGDKDPPCDQCYKIDYPKRKDNQWLKVYSWDTMSNEARPKRWEFHANCGSYLRFESSSAGNSIEYTEGRGHIRMENAVAECDRRAHLNFHPTGTTDMHYSRNKGPAYPEACSGGESQLSGCCSSPESLVTDPPTCHSCSGNACELKGHRVRVVSDLDPDPEACEMIELDMNSFVKIFKTGDIVIDSINKSAYIEILGTQNEINIHGIVLINEFASDSIQQYTPLVHNHGDETIDGFCSHGGCSCESDVSLKKNIENIDVGLNQIKELRPVSFNWLYKIDGDAKHYGLIAQEVEQILPDVVVENRGKLGIKYEELIPVLISAIQEQDKRIKYLEDKLNEVLY